MKRFASSIASNLQNENLEPSSEFNVDNLPEEEKLKMGRSKKLNEIQTMVIKLGTGGDN